MVTKIICCFVLSILQALHQFDLLVTRTPTATATVSMVYRSVISGSVDVQCYYRNRPLDEGCKGEYILSGQNCQWQQENHTRLPFVYFRSVITMIVIVTPSNNTLTTTVGPSMIIQLKKEVEVIISYYIH